MTDDYPYVTSEPLHERGFEITIQRKPHLKAKFRVEKDDVGPLIDELESIREDLDG